MTHTLLTIIALLMLIGGLWAFTQSRSGSTFPIPIAIGGFVLLMILVAR